MTLLMSASESGHLDIVIALLQAGAEVNILDKVRSATVYAVILTVSYVSAIRTNSLCIIY